MLRCGSNSFILTSTGIKPTRWSKRAEAAGSPVLVFTVDALGGNNREILTKVRHQNAEFCETCHDKVPSGKAGGPMPATTPLGPPMMEKAPLTWEYVKRLKDATKMKLVVKGIETREDAALSDRKHGADGVWIFKSRRPSDK